jgi:hypothetical protein
MTEPTNSAPTEGPNLRATVLRNVGGAIGLVLLVAAIFGAIGMIGRADTPTPVAVEQPDRDPENADEGDAPEDPEPDPTDESDDDGAAEAESVDPEADEEPTDAEAEEEPAETDEDAEATETEEPEPEPTEEATEEPAPAGVAPDSVSIQVLDGYKSDGGAAARAIAASLRDGGYRIIAENQALSYDRTVVMWTAGNEAAARQVAAAIGAAEVREQPGNLSSAVDVHVGVGADRA